MRFYLSLTFLFLSHYIFSQDKLGFGGGYIHNIPLNSKGISVKANYRIDNRISISPSIKHFLKTNKVSENYFSVQVNYALMSSYVSKGYSKRVYNKLRPELYPFVSLDYNVLQCLYLCTYFKYFYHYPNFRKKN